MNITITFLMNVFQKAVMDVVYFFIIKKILTIKKELVIDIIKFY